MKKTKINTKRENKNNTNYKSKRKNNIKQLGGLFDFFRSEGQIIANQLKKSEKKLNKLSRKIVKYSALNPSKLSPKQLSIQRTHDALIEHVNMLRARSGLPQIIKR